MHVKNIFDYKKEMVVSSNNISYIYIWRLNNIKSRLSFSSFYICGFLSENSKYIDFYYKIILSIHTNDKVIITPQEKKFFKSKILLNYLSYIITFELDYNK